MSFTPTGREVLLVLLFLWGLISLSNSRFNFQFGGAESTVHSKKPPRSPDGLDKPSRIDRNGRLSWGNGQVPNTRIVEHANGWTIFDNLFMLNGTVFVVSDEPHKLPSRDNMTSNGATIQGWIAGETGRLPSDKDMRIISPREAKSLFGTTANIIDGVTFLVNDPSQYVTHYYHWSAELWFGFWRTYSSLDPRITPSGETVLPPPRRIFFPHLDADHWRDYTAMNEWVLRSSFPSVTTEFSHDWVDRAQMGCPFVFDRVVFADRSAAMIGYNYHRTQRTASEPFALPGSVNWWSTIRNNVIQFTGLESSVGMGTMGKPVITYISRQDWGRRMLKPEDHERLVRELHKLRDDLGYEVNVVSMDKLTRIEQLQLAARTTIMMGVHGNGLTALIWMKPSPRTTIMEFFFPGGFQHDYEFTARSLGIAHYSFWDSHYFTSPDFPAPSYPEGFQGNSIPINGAVVAQLCRNRIELLEETDD